VFEKKKIKIFERKERGIKGKMDDQARRFKP
jgi:hypothetical protein